MSYRTKDRDGNVRVTNGDSAKDPWPVDSIYMSIDSVNPSEKFGGTWVRFANGRMLIGVDDFDSDFNAALDTGGTKTKSLNNQNLPSHSHSMTHSHPGEQAAGTAIGETRPTSATSETGGHYHTANVVVGDTQFSGSTGSQGNSEPFDILPPYIAVFMWRRTA